MPWFKVDDTFAMHPKVAAAGPALALWVRAGSWSAQQLTEGFVPSHMVPALGRPADAKRLVQVGLWEVAEGGFRFHDWLAYQPSRAKVIDDREAAAERKRLSRERAIAARMSRESHTVTGESGHGVTHASVTPTPTRPDPTRPDQGSYGTLSEPPDGGSPPPPSPSRDDPPTPAALVPVADRPDVDALCRRLADRIEANGSKRPTITKAWRDACRLMLDRDGRDPHAVANAIDWCQRDEFWRSNVLSMPKLREQYDRMRLQAGRGNAGTGGNGQRLSPGDRALALIHDMRQEEAQ